MARILIVDDHRISRQFMAAALRQNAVDVKQAATAPEALAIALAWLPDIILMDVRLGDENGYEIARQVSERWPTGLGKPDIRMLSAEMPRSSERDRSGDPGYPVLLKPVNLQHLLRAVLPLAPEPRATRIAQESMHFRTLLREELAEQLPLLEDALGGRDLPQARAILHKLIASGGLCGEQRLERHLRCLQASCSGKKTLTRLAGDYYVLLASARAFLGPAALRGTA